MMHEYFLAVIIPLFGVRPSNIHDNNHNIYCNLVQKMKKSICIFSNQQINFRHIVKWLQEDFNHELIRMHEKFCLDSECHDALRECPTVPSAQGPRNLKVY